MAILPSWALRCYATLMLPLMARSGSVCVPNAVEVDFFSSTLVRNNLGNEGPVRSDPEEMRFSPVGRVDGRDIDLVVTVAPGSTYWW